MPDQRLATSDCAAARDRRHDSGNLLSLARVSDLQSLEVVACRQGKGNTSFTRCADCCEDRGVVTFLGTTDICLREPDPNPLIQVHRWTFGRERALHSRRIPQCCEWSELICVVNSSAARTLIDRMAHRPVSRWTLVPETVTSSRTARACGDLQRHRSPRRSRRASANENATRTAHLVCHGCTHD